MAILDKGSISFLALWVLEVNILNLTEINKLYSLERIFCGCILTSNILSIGQAG